jgi:hypothetical protein
VAFGKEVVLNAEKALNCGTENPTGQGSYTVLVTGLLATVEDVGRADIEPGTVELHAL